jgi:hypothetical protein
MTRRRIDRFLDEALEEFGTWLGANDWWGKEWDCVNLFVHKFLFERIEPGAAIECPTQVSIESAVKQPPGYTKPTSRKDVVIWPEREQTLWSPDGEPVNTPRVVMEWKTYRSRKPKDEFFPYDEEWIKRFTTENPKTFGYVVSVILAGDVRVVSWRLARRGQFGKPRRARHPA